MGAAAAALLLAVPSPAPAHPGWEAALATVVAVEPALPEGVVLAGRAGPAPQLSLTGAGSAVVEVLDDRGRPFLRVARDRVEGDASALALYSSGSPTGQLAGAPPTARDGAPPRWVRLGRGPEWSWYDHRLHPRAGAPSGTTTASVPLRVGSTTHRAEVRLAPPPGPGAFEVTADLPPEELPGVGVQVLQSDGLPGLFLTNGDRLPLVVVGRDGEAFARFGPTGLEVDERSRTRVEDQQARGAGRLLPSTTPQPALLGGAGLSWLDARLRWPGPVPQDALRADRPTTLGRWEVPVVVGSTRSRLTGEIRWVPEGATDARREGLPVLPVAAALVATGLVAGVVLARRRRTR